jgi:hypothetical protein
MMALSLAARWRISIDIKSPVTAHFPDCNSILSFIGDNYEDPDSEYEDPDSEYEDPNSEYSGSDLE